MNDDAAGDFCDILGGNTIKIGGRQRRFRYFYDIPTSFIRK